MVRFSRILSGIGVFCAGMALRPAGASDGVPVFVESPLKPGVYLPVPADVVPPGDTPGAGARGEIPTFNISGMLIPGPVTQDGTLLYVGNNQDNTANLVTVVDISVYGAEAVVDEIDTPVNPVDVAVRDGVIHVIDQARTPLYSKLLEGEEWTTIDLPNAEITEWTYGQIIFLHPFANKIFVIHLWEDLIDIVNLDTGEVEGVIDELSYCPTSMIFTEDRIVVVSTCLDAPSCTANGPNLSVFDLATYDKIYQQEISGEDCAYSLTELNDQVYVSFLNHVKTYDLANGAELDSAFFPSTLSRHIVDDETSIFIQRYDGAVRKLTTDFVPIESANPLDGPAGWSPPLEEMVVLPPEDGRLFVTNRDDNALSVIYFTPTEPPACDGDANGDGLVDPLDSGFVLARFGCVVGGGDPTCDDADVNDDGVVDPLDVGYVQARFGTCE